MTRKNPPRALREPAQVYLDAPDRAILERAAIATGLPKAEVLRRGLRRFAAELLADESPALAFLNSASSAAPPHTPPDVAARHDDYLADWEIASWSATPTARKVTSPVKRKRK